MSLELVAAIAPNIPHHFRKQGVEAFNEEAPFVMGAQKELSKSDACFWTLASTGTNPGFVQEGADVGSRELANRGLDKAQLNRAILRFGFSFSHTDLAVVDSISPEVTADLTIERLATAYRHGMSSAGRLLEIKCAIGTGSETSNADGTTSCGGIVGIIPALLSNVSGSALDGYYAGIWTDMTHGEPSMRPNIKNLSSSAPGTNDGTLTLKAVRQLLAQVQDASGSNVVRFDVWMCSPNTEIAVLALGDDSIRLWSMEQAAAYKIGARSTPSSFAPRCSLEGIPVISNSAWGSSGANLDGYLVGFRFIDMNLQVLNYKSWFDSVRNAKLQGSQVASDVTRPLDLPFYSYTLQKSGASVKVVGELELQLQILALNRVGLIYNIKLS